MSNEPVAPEPIGQREVSLLAPMMQIGALRRHPAVALSISQSLVRRSVGG